MTVCGIDSSGTTAGICIILDGTVVYETTVDEGLKHSETLLPLADKAFADSGLRPSEVDIYSVTAGPGSFTGLRIGLSLAKGLAQPEGVPLITVSTLEALARGVELEGVLVPSLNARRGEVYWAAFLKKTEGLHRLLPDSAEPALALRGPLSSIEGSIFLLGDGAEICREALADSKLPLSVGRLPLHNAKGAALAALEAISLNKPLPAAERARPQYLRLSQAERDRFIRNNISQ